MMREKTCVICKETFTFKNRSKQYCSNACKQQALRNRQKAKLQKINHGNPELSGADNVELINRIFTTYMKQTEAMSKGMSIHHSLLAFMKQTINALRLATQSDNKLKNRLERMQGLINKLNQIAQEQKCEYGYITFDRNTSQYMVSIIGHIKDLRSKDQKNWQK